ncbi:tetratricopeptide repeat protein 6 [Rhinatrema bivittatum]|uniref:tetratricopeptide repeat protein 6 n=1 Tax=Rhinatrema bivittatum TaxID=194408 RepID=UPI001129C0F6|nr:tetratricopeptide repeat protein 6 [Rhinatrema bivittatum]
MAGKQKHLPVELNYSQKQKVKKEFERLHKQSQKDSTYFKDMEAASHGSTDSQLFSLGTEMTYTYDVHKEVRICFSSGKQILDQEVATQGSRSFHNKDNKSKMGDRKQQKCLELKHLTESGSNNEYIGKRKPAIASLLGTTKAAIVLPRPEPPVKHRPFRSTVLSKSLSRQTPTLPQREIHIADRERNIYSASKKTEKVSIKNKAKGKSQFLDSDSVMDRDDQQQSKEVSKKCKKEVIMVKHQILTAEQALSLEKEHEQMKGSTSFVSTPSSKPLTEETEDILMECKEILKQRKPESPRSPKSPLRVTARSLDEIIASLRSPGQVEFHASDYRVKELMERVLGQTSNLHRDESELNVEPPAMEKEPITEQELPPIVQQPDLASELVNEVVPHQAPEIFPVTILDEASVESHHVKYTEPSAVPVSPKSTVDNDSISESKRETEEFLTLSAEVTFLGLLNVKGTALTTKPLGVMGRISGQRYVPYQPVSLLATWTPKNKDTQHLTIHHLCKTSLNHVLPSPFQLASRVLHTVDKYDNSVTSELMGLDLRRAEGTDTKPISIVEPSERSRILHEGIHVSELLEQNLKDSIHVLPPRRPENMDEWQGLAEQYVEGVQMELVGEKVSLHSRALKMFWTPAPPKFSTPLSLVKETLFPQYKTSFADAGVSTFFISNFLEEDALQDEQIYWEDVHISTRVLLRKYHSMPDMRTLMPASASVEELKANVIRRSVSSIDFTVYKEKLVKLSSDFQTSMTELEIQKQKLAHSKVLTVPERLSSSLPNEILTDETSSLKWPEFSLTKQEYAVEMMSLVEAAKKAGTKYIVFPPKKRKTGSLKMLNPQKLQAVLEKLNQPPRILKSSKSLSMLSIHCDPFKVPKKLKHYRNPSLPIVLDFEKFAENRGGIPPDFVAREWVRDIWNTWFDEIFPPSRPESPEEITIDLDQLGSKRKETVQTIRLIDCVSPVLLDSSTPVELEAEVKRLTKRIEEQGETSVFDYFSRGALKRKLGKLKEALNDLNKAILLEPMLLDAYWHRHLIFLLQNQSEDALNDLNFIIKYNRNHADAYMSMAEIYKSQGNYTMAIVNYSRAIKRKPSNDDFYFRRAELHEKRKELVLAMDDYAQCFKYNPRRIDALMRHGLYCFENSNWNTALSDFTAIINQNPNHAQARTYRGRTYVKQSLYKRAVEDFCAAVHLEPLNWTAFFYRGCILQKTHPFRALQDFSVSVLINNGPENLNAFIHRGILYTDLQKWPEAVCDFENAIALDRSCALAYVNLGLIFLLQMNQHFKAIKQFSCAIQANPIYVRAYLCRAHAYHTVHDLPNALKDATRAIHLEPDSQQINVLRGQYLFEMQKFELASFCIHYAAEMNQGSTAMHKALAHSFKQDYSKSIDILNFETKINPSSSKFNLLGKTQMKAKKIQEAIISFKKALEMLSPVNSNQPSSGEAAENLYYLGLCYMEQDNLITALVTFSSAIKVLPDFADAYYQRGLCRMRLQLDVCICDFNRALEINPNFFQAYLSRAAFYGSKGRYIKAILSCNKVIKIQPNSVRAYLYRGALKYYIKAYNSAIEDLTKTIEMDGMCALAYYNRAVCYHQMKAYNKALKDYGIVLLLGIWKEIEFKVLINRGLLYLEMHEYNHALQDFKQATVENPNDVKIHQMIAVCYHGLWRFEEAVNKFTQVLKFDPLCLDSYIARGNSYMEYSNTRGIKLAQKDFQRALHLNPLSIKARICLGYNLQIQGHFQKAWTQFTIALDINPKCHLGYEGRAVVNLQMGDTFAAFQDITAALKIITTAELLTNRGIINQFMGHLPNAMKDYQAAIKVNPCYPLAYFNAANMYFHNRQFTQARDYYSKALNLDPRNESTLLNRAITNTLLQNVQEALKDFEKAISISPFSAIIYFNKANLHSMLHQYKQAEKDFSKALSLQPNDALTYKYRADVRGKMGSMEEAISDYECAINIQTIETKWQNR